MSAMSDFSIWIEDVLVSRGWDIDDPEVQWCINKHQVPLMSMYEGDCPESEVSRAFAGFWHRSVVQPARIYEP